MISHTVVEKLSLLSQAQKSHHSGNFIINNSLSKALSIPTANAASHQMSIAAHSPHLRITSFAAETA